MSAQYDMTLHHSLIEIDPVEWDICAGVLSANKRAPDPFTTYRFLYALEASGSIGGQAGWSPHYAALRLDEELVACAPLYLKGHSQGEYIFDHNWAHAYERAGGHYYPKLQVTVPFTPATGQRLLVKPGHNEQAKTTLLQGIERVVHNAGLSGAHVTFCTEKEANLAAENGWLPRMTQQFHWQNQNYAVFDDFLASLSSRKRKAIRKERATAAGFGGRIEQLNGNQIQPYHWDAIWHFYQDTGARKWGQPYLTRAFFDHLHETMRDDVLLIMAKRQGQYVAGAMNMIGENTLFGRYWGCIEDHPCLHFELCYYQAIDYAIVHALKRVEAGAQGGHKLARGYLPCPTYSVHWFREARFQEAIADYLMAERNATEDEIDILTRHGPFKQQVNKTLS